MATRCHKDDPNLRLAQFPQDLVKIGTSQLRMGTGQDAVEQEIGVSFIAPQIEVKMWSSIHRQLFRCTSVDVVVMVIIRRGGVTPRTGNAGKVIYNEIHCHAFI